MEKQILQSVEEGVRAIQCLRDPIALSFIKDATHLISECFENRGKLLIAGNGGSLCDAMHFAEELTGVFRKKRRGPSGRKKIVIRPTPMKGKRPIPKIASKLIHCFTSSTRWGWPQ